MSMKKNTLFILVLVFGVTSSLFAQTKSPKRGICGDASPQDLAAFSSYISWYYDWGVAPPTVSGGQLSGIEWVPMRWGGLTSGDVEGIKSQIPAGSEYLLGFNEPNFTTQANLTPSQAAAMWPYIEQIAVDKGLKIVSPAVNWCGGCVAGVSSDPTDWLDKFIAACPTCEFDYIAIHNYNSYVSILRSYVDKFRKYGKPIWVTEFASWDDPVDYAGVVQYMKDAIPYLESDTIIFRYSWFATRVGINHNLDLLGANGELTKLGKLYATMPFEGSSAGDIAPIAFLEKEKNINSPTTSAMMSGNTYDANGDVVTIEWSQIEGPSVATINNKALAKPTISGLELGKYIFQMKASANGKADSAQITLNVNAANIAKNKTVTASSVQGDNSASKVNDGNTNSRWSSLDSDPQWIKIDLNGTYDITGAKITWEAAASKVYTIDVSTNGTDWTTVYNTSSGAGGTVSYSFNATARYIRMNSTLRINTSQYWGNSIYEFEVYGTLATGINDVTTENSISVYPNPSKDGLVNVRFNGYTSGKQATLKIHDLSGKLLYSENIASGESNSYSFSTKGILTQGLYILSVQDNSIRKTKLIIE
jgi:hypothetical protein